MPPNVTDHLFESFALDMNTWKLEGAHCLSEKSGLPRLRLGHRQFCSRVHDLQRNGRGAAAGSDVKPPARRICNMSGGSQRFDQQSIERFIRGPVQGEASQIDLRIPPRQQLKVHLELGLCIGCYRHPGFLGTDGQALSEFVGSHTNWRPT
jgi:hypothetical protein